MNEDETGIDERCACRLITIEYAGNVEHNDIEEIKIRKEERLRREKERESTKEKKKKTGKCDVRPIDDDRERLVIDTSRSRMEDKFIHVARGMRQKRRGRMYTHRSRISDINLTR